MAYGPYNNAKSFVAHRVCISVCQLGVYMVFSCRLLFRGPGAFAG